MDEVTARTTALDQAVKCFSHEDVVKPHQIVETAEAFYKFLTAGLK